MKQSNIASSRNIINQFFKNFTKDKNKTFSIEWHNASPHEANNNANLTTKRCSKDTSLSILFFLTMRNQFPKIHISQSMML